MAKKKYYLDRGMARRDVERAKKMMKDGSSVTITYKGHVIVFEPDAVQPDPVLMTLSPDQRRNLLASVILALDNFDAKAQKRRTEAKDNGNPFLPDVDCGEFAADMLLYYRLTQMERTESTVQ
jgi:hypothetical protein